MYVKEWHLKKKEFKKRKKEYEMEKQRLKPADKWRNELWYDRNDNRE